MKEAIRREFKAVVISLPHRADDAIRKNPDLSGWLNLISMEPWNKDELKEIAITGFKQLNIEITDQIASELASESLTSPQLMQSICLNLSLILEIDEDKFNGEMNQVKLEESYKFTTINLPYKEVIKKLKEGPSTRGQQRKTFELKDKSSADVYNILLRAIAENPPIISLSLEEIKIRVDRLTVHSTEKISNIKIKDALQKLQDIIITSDAIYQVFEWKDQQIYILDPLFLFYLRWAFKESESIQ